MIVYKCTTNSFQINYIYKVQIWETEKTIYQPSLPEMSQVLTENVPHPRKLLSKKIRAIDATRVSMDRHQTDDSNFTDLHWDKNWEYYLVIPWEVGQISCDTSDTYNLVIHKKKKKKSLNLFKKSQPDYAN